MFEMVRRQRPERGRELRAAEVAQLAGVQLDAQAESSCNLEYTAGLLERETDRFAEYVHGLDQIFRGQRRQHLFAHGGNIVVRAPREFRRQRVRSEEGGAY